MTTFERLKTAYIDTNKLRYVSRDFPLEAIHPLALSAARAARCAGCARPVLGHAPRHSETQRRADERVVSRAKRPRCSSMRHDSRTCWTMRMPFDGDRSDMADAERVGVTGTPSFVIGRTSGTTLDGILVMGAQPFEAFDAQLKALLARPHRPDAGSTSSEHRRSACTRRSTASASPTCLCLSGFTVALNSLVPFSFQLERVAAANAVPRAEIPSAAASTRRCP